MRFLIYVRFAFYFIKPKNKMKTEGKIGILFAQGKIVYNLHTTQFSLMACADDA